MNAPHDLNPQLLESLAKSHGTPLYVYNEAKIVGQVERLKAAFKAQNINISLHYSVKANPNLGILALLKKQKAHFDVVSGGELERCLKAGAQGVDIVFSGVGKTRGELELGLEKRILQFNIESESELIELEQIACERGIKAPVALRVNPDVDALTHEYITTGTFNNKFGVSINEALHLVSRFAKSEHLEWTGLDMHIGSQLTEEEPIKNSLIRFKNLAQDFMAMGLPLRFLDIGGGLGIRYHNEKIISPERFAELVAEGLGDLAQQPGMRIILEPGRFIVAESGVLLTEVLHIKRLHQKVFYVVDAGMTELMRPALYEAHHTITAISEASKDRPTEIADIVGPICESTDVLGRDRKVSRCEKGDLLAIECAGAYGASMCHNYNTRPRPAEILVNAAGNARIIGKREKLEQLWERELL